MYTFMEIMALQPSAAGSLVDLTYSVTQLLCYLCYSYVNTYSQEQVKGDAKREKHIHIHIYISILFPMEHYKEFLITLPAQRNNHGEAAEGSKHSVLHPHLLINGWDFTYFTSSWALFLAYADLVHSELSIRGARDSSGREVITQVSHI